MASTPDQMSNSGWIDERIAQQVALLIDSDVPWGSRLYAIVEEISNQEGVVNTFATAVRPDVQGETYAKKYLDALKKAKSELQAEAAQSGTNYEDELVYWSVHAAVVRERAGKTPTPVDLASLYQEFRDKYFNDSVPELSQSFSCTFGKLPFDASGICYLEKDASRLGIGPAYGSTTGSKNSLRKQR